jgi:hypothetical protein
VQRITRYPLLLRQIIHYTDAPSSDSTSPESELEDLQSALAIVESIVGNINEQVRENDNRQRLKVLSEDLWIGGEG